MAERIYKAFNSSAPSSNTNLTSAVSTTTNAKTMLQIAAPAGATTGHALTVVDWGYSFDGSVAAAGIEAELISTTSAATTGTAFVAADIYKWNNPDSEASAIQLGAGFSAFSMTSETTVAGTRVLDAMFNQPTNYYAYQFPLGREPVVPLNNFLRLRVKAATAVNILCWVSWTE